jgi:hypothetical protein
VKKEKGKEAAALADEKDTNYSLFKKNCHQGSGQSFVHFDPVPLFQSIPSVSSAKSAAFFTFRVPRWPSQKQ